MVIFLPRSEWRYVDIEAKERMAVVNCEYQVVSENSPVRVVWIARRSLESFRAGRRVNILAASTPGQISYVDSGLLAQTVYYYRVRVLP